MAASVAFSHFGFFVTDMPKMEDFYTRFMGFTVTDRGMLFDRNLVFLSRDPREHHQLVLVTGRPADMGYNPIHQISFLLDGLAELKDMHERLKGEQVSEIAPVSHGNALSVYFRDPEGNRLELYLHTPWYVTQPERVPMDMSLSVDELWKWAEDLARKLPGFRPASEWQAEMARRMGRA